MPQAEFFHEIYRAVEFLIILIVKPLAYAELLDRGSIALIAAFPYGLLVLTSYLRMEKSSEMTIQEENGERNGRFTSGNLDAIDAFKRFLNFNDHFIPESIFLVF